ncbi:hypothetical protein ACSSS7_006756 [Eimeria intestinalis]
MAQRAPRALYSPLALSLWSPTASPARTRSALTWGSVDLFYPSTIMPAALSRADTPMSQCRGPPAAAGSLKTDVEDPRQLPGAGGAGGWGFALGFGVGLIPADVIRPGAWRGYAQTSTARLLWLRWAGCRGSLESDLSSQAGPWKRGKVDPAGCVASWATGWARRAAAGLGAQPRECWAGRSPGPVYLAPTSTPPAFVTPPAAFPLPAIDPSAAGPLRDSPPSFPSLPSGAEPVPFASAARGYRSFPGLLSGVFPPSPASPCTGAAGGLAFPPSSPLSGPLRSLRFLRRGLLAPRPKSLLSFLVPFATLLLSRPFTLHNRLLGLLLLLTFLFALLRPLFFCTPVLFSRTFFAFVASLLTPLFFLLFFAPLGVFTPSSPGSPEGRVKGSGVPPAFGVFVSAWAISVPSSVGAGRSAGDSAPPLIRGARRGASTRSSPGGCWMICIRASWTARLSGGGAVVTRGFAPIPYLLDPESVSSARAAPGSGAAHDGSTLPPSDPSPIAERPSSSSCPRALGENHGGLGALGRGGLCGSVPSSATSINFHLRELERYCGCYSRFLPSASCPVTPCFPFVGAPARGVGRAIPPPGRPPA